MLACFWKCKHAYHREDEFEGSKIDGLPAAEVAEAAKCLLAQMHRLLDCGIEHVAIIPQIDRIIPQVDRIIPQVDPIEHADTLDLLLSMLLHLTYSLMAYKF